MQGNRFAFQQRSCVRQNVSGFQVYIDTGLHRHGMAFAFHFQNIGLAKGVGTAKPTTRRPKGRRGGGYASTPVWWDPPTHPFPYKVGGWINGLKSAKARRHSGRASSRLWLPSDREGSCAEFPEVCTLPRLTPCR